MIGNCTECGRPTNRNGCESEPPFWPIHERCQILWKINKLSLEMLRKINQDFLVDESKKS